MAERKSATRPAKSAPKSAPKKPTKEPGFTAEERAAMRERAKESDIPDERAVLDKLAAMAPADRAMGERLHAIITATAPELAPRLWYGMPAYAKNGKVVCFFQDARKFKSRYATLGFSDQAALDDGQMWPTTFALMELTAADEARITALVRRAVGE